MTGRSHPRSPEARAWRSLYKDRRWTGTARAGYADGLRMQCFVRDLFTCRHCGGPVTLDRHDRHHAVADHIRDHKGDPALFFDIDNLRTTGKSCHDRHSQREAHGTARPRIALDGMPIDPDHPWNR